MLKAKHPKHEPDGNRPSTLPLRHIAIIMDGNRRWADAHKKPRLLGHREGVQSLKRLVKHAGQLRLPYLTVYAFSSENWQRGPEEVDYLMNLFREVVTKEIDELAHNNVRLRFIGDLQSMPPALVKDFARAQEKTAPNTGLNLQVALNYGSRLEISQAARKITEAVLNGQLHIEQITPDLISNHLYTAGLPDPDLMIRTGGEMRLSNYLLWQSAYTELYVTPVMWPDFTPTEFDRAVEEFSIRQRRYGGN